jgi:hypothetical protein
MPRPSWKRDMIQVLIIGYVFGIPLGERSKGRWQVR